ncbi:hypothetical protein RvY_08708 [Ramazzottius varieornatus]|uniref:carbonyl reductase (NADPH) n=1 Tax=Ramazzottius varieornatus TaxID=947166 RepID=A0A1D1V6T3_RAMVA|nr:hypothetical protein RvY_08708 [Ramazzottius varieornatus]
MSAGNSSSPAALVTGANKGIGYETVRQLSKEFKGTIYLTARDEARGKEAVKKLHEEGTKNVEFLQMDVTDGYTINAARNFIKEKHGGLDVLVNNAGIAAQDETVSPAERMQKLPSLQVVQRTIATNFNGLLDVCKAFFPILRPHARVVNVSSELGTLKRLENPEIKGRLVADDLTVAEVEKIMAEYAKFEPNENNNNGYPDTGIGPYAMSKIGVTAVSRVQQRDFDREKPEQDIIVNACCPGYVATDLNHHSGFGTVQEGADTPVYLALLPPQDGNQKGSDIPRGQFVKNRKVLDWVRGQGGLGKEDMQPFMRSKGQTQKNL